MANATAATMSVFWITYYFSIVNFRMWADFFKIPNFSLENGRYFIKRPKIHKERGRNHYKNWLRTVKIELNGRNIFKFAALEFWNQFDTDDTWSISLIKIYANEHCIALFICSNLIRYRNRLPCSMHQRTIKIFIN